MQQLKLFFIALPIYLLIDYLWLGVFMKNHYRDSLILFAKKIDGQMVLNYWVAAFAYLLIVLGLTIFVFPRISTGNQWEVLLSGIIFGLVVYGAYELTNLSFIKNWPIKIVVLDILWGGIICGITSFIIFYINKFIK